MNDNKGFEQHPLLWVTGLFNIVALVLVTAGTAMLVSGIGEPIVSIMLLSLGGATLLWSVCCWIKLTIQWKSWKIGFWTWQYRSLANQARRWRRRSKTTPEFGREK